MAAIEVGRVCIKLRGNDAGNEVVITKILDNNFVMVKDSKGKESKVLVRHLDPTPRISKA